ncbi:MAG: carboxylate--amine ligase [Gammaproteobacteria bacterium RIFOXYA12_FULL_61_12]|nr:MAG: carboxylate--amine ligase [Gammaproteobacteria bacterium RIFOXYA12_FULL_61_12]OGT89959.1 MAG: carboxylate--amine ligase [Gammaproteobacteria bacterium RIFOXYD12_FULL_61_37]
MSEHILLVDDIRHWKEQFPGYPAVSVQDYLTCPQWSEQRGLRVINLCRDTQYHSPGYYASLLAEARGHKAIPSVRTIQDLSRKALYGADLEDLDKKVGKLLGGRRDIETTRFELTLCFGKCETEELKGIARSLFETFPAPLLKVEFRLRSGWHIAKIRTIGLKALKKPQQTFFFGAMNDYFRQRHQAPRGRKHPRYDLAILHDPDESLPPSNPRAIAAFVRAAKKVGMNAELITRKDYGRLAEYDALFIRETTNVNHHTYRFARKAASEGLVVIDDPDSILRCTNKIYLMELLSRARIPTPKSVVIGRNDLAKAEEELGYPMVLKIPDGAFSLGVYKIDNQEQLKERAAELFRETELVLAQAYTYTPFDWRVGILNNEVLYVCRYYMSNGHWQIVDHSGDGAPREGLTDSVSPQDAPAVVVQNALNAAKRIGDGLYGVDLKETPEGILVIEVNDNPSIDAGDEDRLLGDELYLRIMREFVKRLDRHMMRSP